MRRSIAEFAGQNGRANEDGVHRSKRTESEGGEGLQKNLGPLLEGFIR
jgi:hypothetical protein